MMFQNFCVFIFVHAFCNLYVYSQGIGVSAQGKGSLSATGNLGISGTVTPQLSNFIRDCLTPECIRNGGVNLLQKILFQKGRIQTGNKIYHLGMEKVSFCQAMKQCDDLSMKLSTIENESENEAVLKYLTKKGVNTPVWISANKCYGTKWYTLDGKELSYFNWSQFKFVYELNYHLRFWNY
ncbi:uncharacterized protein [Leptinotarsa decemlineata]|uniref:uncharacterized protein n=1 Tax=Leptinotarsa decemlineata TaxID=7539 RepID=UPI003D30C8E2